MDLPPQILGVLGFGLVMLVILLFILALVWGISRIERVKARPPQEQLAARFARGEISEAEYLRSLAILEHGTDFVLEERGALLRKPGPGDS